MYNNAYLKNVMYAKVMMYLTYLSRNLSAVFNCNIKLICMQDEYCTYFRTFIIYITVYIIEDFIAGGKHLERTYENIYLNV